MTSWKEIGKRKAKLGKWINQELGASLPWGSMMTLKQMQKLKKEIEKKNPVRAAERR